MRCAVSEEVQGTIDYGIVTSFEDLIIAYNSYFTNLDMMERELIEVREGSEDKDGRVRGRKGRKESKMEGE